MTDHPNVELIKRGHEAFAKQDLATLTELIPEDTVWHVAGHGPMSGDLVGRDAVFGWFLKVAELTQGSLALEPHDYIGNDDHVVALTRVTATRGDKHLDVRQVEVGHWRDGKLTENWVVTDDQQAADAFWD
jgi:ketosteroid isomerase-like protein